MTEETESSHKAPKLKVGDNVKIIFLAKITKIFVIDSVLKTNSWTNKIKSLNGEKVTGIFYEKKLLPSKL